MKFMKILAVLLLLTPLAFSQNYQVDWYVMASGGGEMTSTSYSVNGTMGQEIMGRSTSTNYIVESGFWVGAGAAGCEYVVGDVNGSGSYNGLDITFGVNYFKGGLDPLCPLGSCPVPPCNGFFYCGDVNGSCSYNGLDITYGVNYFKGGSGPIPCPDCEPAGPPVSASSGKPVKSTKVLKRQ
jgi:hypothetical protein